MLGYWWASALELSWKSAAVIAAACAASWLLRSASAAVRHMVWGLALASLLLLPALEAFLPAWRASALPHGSVTISETRFVEPAHDPAQVPRPVPGPLSGQLAVAAFAVWIAGTLLCLWRWRSGTQQVARLRIAASSFPENHPGLMDEVAGQLGLRRPVTLLSSDREIVPMAAGLRRPAVLLPASASRWSRDRLRVVLLHEMAHLRRNDCLMQALAELTFCLYWFNPLVWFAMRRLRVERERACDDLVLFAGSRPSDYAAHLLDLARSLDTRDLSPVAIAMASSPHLETRLRAILNPHLNRRALTRAAAVVACLVAACFVLPLAAMRPQATDARTISGTVYDPAGAVVPGARVVLTNALTNADTGQKWTAATDQEGKFSISIGSLPHGAYTLDVEARGFAAAVRRLNIADSRHLDITLDIGSVEETVVVHGKGAASTAPAGPHRTRVGGNVIPAKLVHQTNPEYPEDAQSRGVQGAVVLRAVISVDGTPLSLTSLTSPDPQLTEAAINAVKQWRYQPSLLNGEPVETATTITVNFQLEP
jgi:TonB family protein